MHKKNAIILAIAIGECLCLLCFIGCYSQDRSDSVIPAPDIGNMGTRYSADTNLKCKNKAVELEKWLRDVSKDWQQTGEGTSYVAFKLAEIEKNKGHPPRIAPNVLIDEEKVILESQLVNNSEEMYALLTQFSNNYKKIFNNKPPSKSINMIISENAPWSTITWVVNTCTKAGYNRIAFLYEPKGGGIAKYPGSSKHEEVFRQILNGEQVVEFASLWRSIAPLCREVQKAGERRKESRITYFNFMADILPQAVMKCNCNVDIPSIKGMMWTMLYLAGGPRVSISVNTTLGNRKKAQVIEFEADKTWLVTHSKVIKAAILGDRKPIIFEVSQ